MAQAMSEAEAQNEAHSMSCMEIWGGNRAIDSGVSSPGIDAWVVSRPYGEAESGGDIHYVSMCAAGKIARFAVADVAGHGDAVSGLAVTLRDLMRKGINTVDQSKFARTLNEAFLERSHLGVFATAILATYFAPSDHLIVCNAGHPAPLIYRAGSDAWSMLEAEVESSDASGVRGLPLGIIEPTEYTQQAVALAKGDIVVVYTDSMMEQKDSAGRMVGTEGLLALCKGLDTSRPEGVAHELIGRVRAFGGGRMPDDDLTVMVLHHNGSDPPKMSVGERLTTYARLLGLSKV